MPRLSASDLNLLVRLQLRNADRAIATDGGIHPRAAVPTVSAAQLNAIEKSLGFALPQIVRSLYVVVGNGGFGPAYGIVGVRGGAKLEGKTLETCYHGMRQLHREHPMWKWPEQLLPLANAGCGMWSCVDCTYKSLPMILWDPNNLDSDSDDADARIRWCYSFWDQGMSVKAWLRGWLSGCDEPEPKRPSLRWTKSRIEQSFMSAD